MVRANGPSRQASRFPLRFPLKATDLESWFFFNTTEKSTSPKGAFPFKAVAWEATHCCKGLPPCKAVGTTSLLRASSESRIIFSPSPAYVAGLPLTSRSRFWKQPQASSPQNGRSFPTHLIRSIVSCFRSLSSMKPCLAWSPTVVLASSTSWYTVGAQ